MKSGRGNLVKGVVEVLAMVLAWVLVTHEYELQKAS